MDAVINPDKLDKQYPPDPLDIRPGPRPPRVEFTPGYELAYDVDPHGDTVPTFEAHEHEWRPDAPYSESLICGCGQHATYCQWRSGRVSGTFEADA